MAEEEAQLAKGINQSDDDDWPLNPSVASRNFDFSVHEVIHQLFDWIC